MARLTRDDVLDAAWGLLADEGLDGLSMRRLARRLGVVPMAVYRHVSGRDELVDALLDRLTALVPVPGPRVGPRVALERIAQGIRGTVVQHAALVPLLVLRPAWGASAQRLGERAYVALRAAGVDDADVPRAWNLLALYALGFAVLEAPRVAPEAVGGALPAQLEDVPAPGRPDLPLTSELGLPPSEFVSSRQFRYGLARLLDAVLQPRDYR